LNSINQRDCVVEIEFIIGTKFYKVIRGLKPGIFEVYCDYNLVTQNASVKDYQEHLEKNILKLNHKSFTQIVVLGSASFTPFMQLSAADRRQIIEDLLDIQIFSKMNTVLKDKVQSLKDAMAQIKGDVAIHTERMQSIVALIQTLERNSADKIKALQSHIANTTNEITECKTNHGTLSAENELLTQEIIDLASSQKKLAKQETIKVNLSKTSDKICNDIAFYHNTETCPTCKQTITESFKQKVISDKTSKHEEVTEAIKTLEEESLALKHKINLYEGIANAIANNNTEISKWQIKAFAAKSVLDSLNRELESVKNSKTDLNEQKAKLNLVEEQLKEFQIKHTELSTQKSYYDAATSLLKDGGIKTRIVKQYIPIINKLVNKNLQAMDFFVNFTLDESFKETIKSRHRDDFSYASFSEGEKQRIDMALMLTWRAVAKLKNSANTNLLILDEIFDSSLDANGTEDLMKILAMLDDSNLFVISHKGDSLQDRFDNVIKFEKVNNFSRIAK
jgi:DNA repair exonuclease SbcCD ATPase subunit